MVDTDGENKSIVTRLRGSQRIMALVLVAVLLIASAGIVAAFGTSEYDWEEWEDYEDGTTGISSGQGDIVTDSYEDTYSWEVEGTESLNAGLPINYSDGDTEFYTRLKIDANNIGNQDGGALMLGPSDSDLISLEFDSYNQVAHLATNGNELDSWSGFSAATWYNVHWVVENGDEHSVYFWEPGTPKPDTPQLTMTSSVGNPTNDLYLRADTNVRNLIDEMGAEGVPPTGIEGIASDEAGNELANVTIEAAQNGSVIESAETNSLGQYELAVENGTYNVTASKAGYFTATETVEVQGEIVEQDFQLRNHSAALSIDGPAFLEHGESAPYAVVYESRNGSDARLTREDVTDQATVTSGDTSIVSVNPVTERVTATSDKSVNNLTYITAEYSTGGETYTTRQNITVANETVDNLDILPPVQRFTASLSGGTDANPDGKTIMLLIIGAAAGAAASLIATSFAGVAALTMVMMLGWIMGMLGNGMAIVTVFIALFVGLNVAGNVDYTVRR